MAASFKLTAPMSKPMLMLIEVATWFLAEGESENRKLGILT
jgi:hypothetical protein